MAQVARSQKGDVLVLVGTRKGAFILSSDGSRSDWSVSGPYAAGGDVFHMAYDSRDGGTLLAAINSPAWRPEIRTSSDLGATWTDSKEGPKFENTNGTTIERVWHIEPGRDSEPGVVYAGAEPASLFRSEDGGSTWSEVSGLTDHPAREKWQPGFGGLCLHSIVLDPSSADRMWVGISAVGVFATNDGGETWHTQNKGVRADFLPDPFPEFGQCPHKALAHSSTPQLLYQQNHCGVFRSANGGDEREDISEGLPSRFGFVLGLNSHDPDTLFVLSEDTATVENAGGTVRYVPDASFRVFRSQNGGKTGSRLPPVCHNITRTSTC